MSFSELLVWVPLAAYPAACLAGVLAAVTASLAVVRTRGSTAMPAALWAVAACGGLSLESGLRAAGGLNDPAASAGVRLAVGAMMLCPAMSLLGAKRPQHRVWQLIVASLWMVLLMPALSARLARPGSLPDVHLLERGFLLVLALVGWMNFIGTRRGWAATLITAGQLAWLWPFLPGVSTAAAIPQPVVDCAGAWLIALPAVIAATQGNARPRLVQKQLSESRPASIAILVNRPFLALRETLGAAWTLRIAERFDTLATAHGWPCRLRFGGLEVSGNPTDASWHPDALRAIKSLFHRFVTDDWLARHGWPSAK